MNFSILLLLPIGLLLYGFWLMFPGPDTPYQAGPPRNECTCPDCMEPGLR